MFYNQAKIWVIEHTPAAHTHTHGALLYLISQQDSGGVPGRSKEVVQEKSSVVWSGLLTCQLLNHNRTQYCIMSRVKLHIIHIYICQPNNPRTQQN